MAYRGHREVDVALRDGSTVHMRPVRATDAPAVRAFIERLSPESTGLRFFSGFPNLDSAVGWATQVDYRDRYGLVATMGDDGQVIAHAGWQREHQSQNRLAILPDVTHYDMFLSPLLTTVAVPFLAQLRRSPTRTAGTPHPATVEATSRRWRC